MPRGRYLVGIDFSAESRRALDAARRLARRSGASITIAHVRPLSDIRAAVVEERGDLLRQPARELARQIAAHYAERFAALARAGERTLLLRGGPNFALVREAKNGYELLVVGRGGRGGVEGLFLGSTATRVLSRCPIPVLVVPSVSR
jgi:nucleotide-binding universal stress UspA family protein